MSSRELCGGSESVLKGVVKVNKFVMAKGKGIDVNVDLNLKGLQRYGSLKEVRWSQEDLICETCKLDLAEERSRQERGEEAANPESSKFILDLGRQ